MNKSKNASIINISSIYGVNAPDWNLYQDTNINNPAAYSISKAGLIYMTKWLASTLAPNIRVNAISPGGILRQQEKLFIKKYNEKTLLNRMATESDVSEPVLFLASNMSSYITGQNLIIDGGWTIK
jgi:NAD(P)-dependent dehydrogenase (short-subunit alcohol dehydrogenase family)